MYICIGLHTLHTHYTHITHTLHTHYTHIAHTLHTHILYIYLYITCKNMCSIEVTVTLISPLPGATRSLESEARETHG